jgi:hypothetical protein
MTMNTFALPKIVSRDEWSWPARNCSLRKRKRPGHATRSTLSVERCLG